MKKAKRTGILLLLILFVLGATGPTTYSMEVEPILNAWGLTGRLAKVDKFLIMPENQMIGTDNTYAYLLEEILTSQMDAGFRVSNYVSPEHLATLREIIGDRDMQLVVKDYTGAPFNKPWYLPANLASLTPEQIDTLAQNFAAACEDYEDIIFMYYGKDEPGISYFPNLNKVITSMEKYTDKPVLVNLLPTYAEYYQLGVPNEGTKASRYRAYLDALAAQGALVDRLCYDNYGPSTSSEGNYPSRLTDYLENLAIGREYALRYHIPLWNTTLACQLRQEYTLFPAQPTLYYYVYTSLMFGCKGIAWFSYSMKEAANINGLVAYPEACYDFTGEEVTQTWHYVKEANRQANILGDRMIKMQSTGVYFRNLYDQAIYDESSEISVTAEGQYLKNVTAEGIPLGVGEFVDVDGTCWAMVSNLSFHDVAGVSLTLQSGYDTLEIYSTAQQTLKPYAADETLYIAPGMGYLFRIS